MIVLIAVTEKQVVITDQFNPGAITGRQSIFAKVNAPTEMKADVEIVGVYRTLDAANAGRANHAQAHPGRRYVQKVCQLNEVTPTVETPKCITCGTPIGPRGSFCPPCQKQHYAECVAADPRGGEGDVVPVIQTNHGQYSTILNQGN